MTNIDDRSSEVREVDRIVVRFAGDSGDGMQLTGDRFTSASALFGNDLATHAARVPRRDPCPGRDVGRRVRVPGPHLRSRHHHPRRRAQRAGGDESGRDEERPGEARARRHGDRQHRRVRRAESGQGGLRDEPARGRHPRRLHRHHRTDDRTDQGGVQGPRRETPRRGTVEELLRPRAGHVALHPADGSHPPLDQGEVRRTRGGDRRERSGLQGGPCLR